MTTTDLPLHYAALPQRSVLDITGEDRMDFLQGLITADIYQLPEHKVLWSAILTPQGRLIADFFLIYNGPSSILLECACGQAETIIQFFTRFRLRAKVSIAPTSLKVDILWGSPPPKGYLLNATISFNDPRLKDAGTHLLHSNTQEDHINASDRDYVAHRLRYGLPDLYVDAIQGQTLPAEGNMDLLGGISWDKGCYIGQEITARLHFRKRLKKRLIPLRCEGALPPIGTPLTCQGKDVGQMRSSYKGIGLGMLKTANLGSSVEDPHGHELQICLPSWLSEGLREEQGAPS